MPNPSDADKNRAELEAAAARRKANDELAKKQQEVAKEIAEMQAAREQRARGANLVVPLALATATALGIQGPDEGQNFALNTSRTSSATNAANVGTSVGVRLRAQLSDTAVDIPAALPQQQDGRSDIAWHQPVFPHHLERCLEM